MQADRSAWARRVGRVWQGYRSLRFASYAAAAGLCAVLAIRGYGEVPLAAAQRGLAETVGKAELRAVEAALTQPEERPALRLAQAIQPYAVGKPQGAELLAQCRRAVAASTHATLADEPAIAPTLAERRPPWAKVSVEMPGLFLVGPAYTLLLRCGLASDGDSFSPEIGLPAVELLGEVARDLERGPSLLALALGLRAEKHQLTLIERLHERPLAAADRARLQNALQTGDLASRRRRVLIAEALLATDYRTAISALDENAATRALLFVVGPLAAAAQIGDIARMLREEDSTPAWPDTWFVGTQGLRRSWQRLLDAPSEVAMRRERVRRLLAL